jgi:hypothetical protein
MFVATNQFTIVTIILGECSVLRLGPFAIPRVISVLGVVDFQFGGGILEFI